MSRNTYDRTKWYTINDAALQEALGCTTGQSVPLEGTPGPHHEEDTVSPSLKEEKREKKEPEGEIAVGVEEEYSLPAEPKAAAADTAPGETAPQAENHTTELSVPSHAPEQPGAAKQPAPTAKQQACPHPVTQCVTFSDGITICNHCFGLVAFDPLADAA